MTTVDYFCNPVGENATDISSHKYPVFVMGITIFVVYMIFTQ